jgi:hypothetical protein
MEQGSSSEVDSHSAVQEIACLLFDQKVHYRVHKRPPQDPILSQKKSVHTTHLIL